MAGLFDEWDGKKERAQRPVDPQATPTAPATGARATAYAAAALAGEVDNIRAVPIGSGRNDQLNKSALKMGQLVAAGAIDERTVVETLGAADGGLDYDATRKTINSGLRAGMQQTRAIPDSAHTQKREVAPWETCSDDPFADHYTGPLPGLLNGSTLHPDGTVTTPDTSASFSPDSVATAASSNGDVASAAGSTCNDDPAYVRLVQAEAASQRLRRDARRLVDAEDAVRDFRVPPFLPTLADELTIPDEPVTYAVDRLIPTGANVLLTAQYKTGKTTLINNLARAFADGVPFLGRYDVDTLDGRVAIFNYEVDRAQYRRWLREAGIEHTDRVAPLNLRGYRLPLMVPHIETWVVEWLKQAEASVWIVDPFARAAVGSITSENDNTEVGAFLDTLDVIKDRAGVSELILPTHTGRGEQEAGDERARGATRLDDWADVRWLLTKDKHSTRYFRATGRDVETDESALEYDEATRLLTLTGGTRWEVEHDKTRTAILTIVRDRPGIGARELRDVARDVLRGVAVKKIGEAVDDLIAARQIHRERRGHTHGHMIGPPPSGRPEPDPTLDPFDDP